MRPAAPLLFLLVVSLAATAGEAPTAALAGSDGAGLYARLCVACHGPDGRGDGPVAAALKVRPADLTTIRARNGGVFPQARVQERIDGRAAPSAHGTREMPIWGYELEARVAADSPGRATAQAMTDRLVEYLRSLQQ